MPRSLSWTDFVSSQGRLSGFFGFGCFTEEKKKKSEACSKSQFLAFGKLMQPFCPLKDHTCGFACFCPLIRNHSYPPKTEQMFLRLISYLPGKKLASIYSVVEKERLFFKVMFLKLKKCFSSTL